MNHQSRLERNSRVTLNAQIERELQRNLKEIYLRPWEECTGILQGLIDRKDKLLVVVLLNHSHFGILFAKGSQEAEIIKKELPYELIGRKIGIVKTDTENPIRIRKFPSLE